VASYLGAQQPERWTVSDLKRLRGVSDDAERADELAFAREWFPALRELYRHARQEYSVRRKGRQRFPPAQAEPESRRRAVAQGL